MRRGEPQGVRLWTGQVRRPLQEQKRVDVDLPTWMIESLDREASRLCVTRQQVADVPQVRMQAGVVRPKKAPQKPTACDIPRRVGAASAADCRAGFRAPTTIFLRHPAFG